MDTNEQLSEENISQLSEKALDSLEQILLNTQEQCQMVEHLIKNQIEVKDTMINKLHQELEYYKQESANRFVEQLMKAIIKVRKDMKKVLAMDNRESMTAEDFRREYAYVYEDLTDLLEQQNIDEYSSSEGDCFEAAIHQPKIETTSDMLKDKKIKESLSEGYIKGNKVLIPERVIVYQYKE